MTLLYTLLSYITWTNILFPLAGVLILARLRLFGECKLTVLETETLRVTSITTKNFGIFEYFQMDTQKTLGDGVYCNFQTRHLSFKPIVVFYYPFVKRDLPNGGNLIKIN